MLIHYIEHGDECDEHPANYIGDCTDWCGERECEDCIFAAETITPIYKDHGVKLFNSVRKEKIIQFFKIEV